MTGREKCKLLKRIRANIAADNGIKGFEYKPCLSVWECHGTCPACDTEALELQRILQDKGMDVNVPRDPNMPKDLIGAMDNNVYQDMQTIAEQHVYGWNYDDVEVGRMLTRKSYSEMPDSEQHYKYPKVVARPGCTVGMITPYRDWEKLDEDAVMRKKRRGSSKTKNKNKKKSKEDQQSDKNNAHDVKKSRWFVANQFDFDNAFDPDKNGDTVLEQMQTIDTLPKVSDKSKKRKRKERYMGGNIAVRRKNTHMDKFSKIPRGLLHIFKKKDDDN